MTTPGPGNRKRPGQLCVRESGIAGRNQYRDFKLVPGEKQEPPFVYLNPA
jgi:hypothetical protein